MNSSIVAIRAIATEFAYRIFKPIVITTLVVGVLLIALMIWLIVMNGWWWLLAIPVFFGVLVGAALLVIVGIILRVVAPHQTKSQKQKISAFVDKLQRLSEITQTPKVVLLIRAVRDVVAPQKEGFIKNVISDTASLKKDFKDLSTIFSSR